MGKIAIHRFHVSRKCYEVQSRLCSIHGKFGHGPSLVADIGSTAAAAPSVASSPAYFKSNLKVATFIDNLQGTSNQNVIF